MAATPATKDQRSAVRDRPMMGRAVTIRASYAGVGVDRPAGQTAGQPPGQSPQRASSRLKIASKRSAARQNSRVPGRDRKGATGAIFDKHGAPILETDRIVAA